MKKLLILLVIGTAFIIFFDLDSFIEKINDFINPTFNISILNPSLEKDGVMTLEVLLENVTNSPIFVDKLELTFIVIPTRVNYEKRKSDIIVGKTIDKKDDLRVYVILSDYYNPEVEPEAEARLRQKKENFGIKITVKDKIGDTIKWAKRKIDFSL